MRYERPRQRARSGRGLCRLTYGVCLVVLGVAATLRAQPATQPTPVTASAARPLHTLVEAELRADRIALPVNSAVEMEFILRNVTDEYVQLDVPLGPLLGKLPQGFALHGMGLPLEHIFSGRLFRALSIVGEGDPYLGDIVSRGPRRTIPSIMLAPFAEVGLKFDITRFYPVLKHEGRYDIQWHPYGDEIRSNTLTIEVRAQKQVVMETSQGRLTIRLLYDAAPATVEHFLRLVERRFYDRLAFFAVDPSLAIQAGCPNNDGTGRGPEGRTIAPEFNDTPFDEGTIGMSLARLPSGEVDPSSASCQFFICLDRWRALDGVYTAFARVEGPKSMQTLERIAETPRGPDGRPLEPVTIHTAVAIDAPTAPPF